jgi:endonuclease III
MKLREKINFVKSVLFEMYPDAITELDYETEFQLLVAIIMSAQTTDKQVNKVNTVFFQYLKNPSDGMALGEEFIREKIKSVSFFNNKAKNILSTSNILVSKYDSQIPRTLNELIELP